MRSSLNKHASGGLGGCHYDSFVAALRFVLALPVGSVIKQPTGTPHNKTYTLSAPDLNITRTSARLGLRVSPLLFSMRTWSFLIALTVPAIPVRVNSTGVPAFKIAFTIIGTPSCLPVFVWIECVGVSGDCPTLPYL